MPKRSGIENGSKVSKLEQPPQLKERLQEIISRPLTAANIGTYFDDALSELIELTDRVAGAYKQAHPNENAKGGELEDKAFEYFNLESIPEILASISVAKVNVGEVAKRMEGIEISDGVLVPPTEQRPNFGNGSGTFELAKISERVRLLLYILKNEGIPVEDAQAVSIRQGTITDTMLRQVSYTRVEIPSLNRIALVCDEEGNATYVFDSDKAGRIEKEGRDISALNKEELNQFIQQNPGAGVRFSYGPRWSERLRGFLTEPIEASQENGSTQDTVLDPTIPRVSKSELDPWRGFWTDPETGKHYGGIDRIGKKLDVLFPREMSWRSNIRTKIENSADQLQARQVILLTGMPADAYAYEDVRALITDKEIVGIADLVRENEGEWKGFYTLTSENLHFGVINILKGRGGILKDADNLLNRINLNIDKVRTRERIVGTTTQKLYCFEDVVPLFKERAAMPQLEKSGEWFGFYLNTDGKQYGTLGAIGTRIGASRRLLEALTTESGSVPTLSVLDFVGKVATAYPLDEVESLYKSFLAIPKIEEDGVWKGFVFNSEDGKHYGMNSSIGRKIAQALKERGIKSTEAAVLLQTDSFSRTPQVENLPRMSFRDSVGRRASGFSYEDFLEAYTEYFLSAPKVNERGEWDDFFLDSETGLHYGSFMSIARRIVKLTEARVEVIRDTTVRERMKRIADIEALPTRTLQNFQNVKIQAYVYEDVANAYFRKFPLEKVQNGKGLLETAPEGWYLNRTLAKEVGTTQKTATAIANQYRETHPEWFKAYRSRGHFPQDREHYHPDLVEKIREAINSRPESAPEGWMNRGDLRDNFRIQYPVTDRIIASYRESHPEWFGTYLSKTSKSLEYFHPDLVAKVREAANK